MARLGTRKQLLPSLWWKESKEQGPKSKSFSKTTADLLKELRGRVKAEKDKTKEAAKETENK